MKTWRIGVVGAGVIADFHARAINDIENAELMGFCDSGSGHAKELAEKYSCRVYADYQEMADEFGKKQRVRFLEELDALYAELDGLLPEPVIVTA